MLLSVLKYVALIFIINFLLIFNLKAQDNKANSFDVIKLKNGNIIRGKIRDKEDDILLVEISKSVKIKLPYTEVESIEPGVQNKPEEDDNKYYALSQVNLLFGKRNDGYSGNVLVSPSLHISGGYVWKQQVQFGAGVGLEKFGKLLLIPVYVDIRGELLSRTFSPYYNIKLGGVLAGVEDDFRYQTAKGRAMGEIGGGLSMNFNRLSWLVGVGYRTMDVELRGSDEFSQTERYQIRRFRRLVAGSTLKIAF